MSLAFELLHVAPGSGARLGRLITGRGEVQTPAFMPVGTLATVKGLTTDLVRASGAEILLANTYHLALRPGEEVIHGLGGLHRFMGWDLPILTDSGGFQIFSLARLADVNDAGVTFRSHIDGAVITLTPERAMQIQCALGSDIAMVLDQVPPLPGTRSDVETACQRTLAWAERCRAAPRATGQAVFGIVQGGLDLGMRTMCAQRLIELDFDGYAIGGLSVGEDPQDMYIIVQQTCPSLPVDRPRYLMGVGRPEDLLRNIAGGIDMFDCVMPTRNGRNATAFSDAGPLKMRNAAYQSDSRPIDEQTRTPYSHLSRAYIRHLFVAGEMLGPILLSLHNLAYYQRLMSEAREAIAGDCFSEFCRRKFAGWGRADADRFLAES